jgi:hypothetical protein
MSRICAGGAWVLGVALVLAVFAGTAAEKTSASASSQPQARALTRAALEAEAQDRNDDRAKQLAAALAADGGYAPARWHSGYVLWGRQWLPLTEAEQRNAADPKRDAYLQQREKAGDDPRLVLSLAQWCAKEGLSDRALAHYGEVLMSASADEQAKETATRRLGMQMVDGAWFTRHEVEARQKRASATNAATAKWRPRLERLRMAIDGDESNASKRAIQELDRITDPQIALALESFLPDGGERFSQEAAKTLGRFPQQEATEALVRYAVLSDFSGARYTATTALEQRPIYDYMPLLLTGLTTPIEYRVASLGSHNGGVAVRETLTQEDGTKRLVRVQDETVLPLIWHSGHQYYSVMGPSGIGPIGLANHATTVANRVNRDLASVVKANNEQTRAINDRIFAVLEQLSPTRLPRDVNQYWKWWQHYNEYDGQKPTYYTYQQQRYVRPFQAGSCCFPAGTLVCTDTGSLPIESIKVGDRVLSQDQDTGELAFKVVLRTTARAPSPTLCIHTASDDITATLGHPFWVDGRGWKMAKELAPGDLLHSLSGGVRVDSIEPGGDRAAYNLVVDDFHTYLVGNANLLVHDNEFRQPTRAIVPGLTTSATASK